MDRCGIGDNVDNRDSVVDIQSDCCDTALSKGLSEKMPFFALGAWQFKELLLEQTKDIKIE